MSEHTWSPLGLLLDMVGVLLLSVKPSSYTMSADFVNVSSFRSTNGRSRNQSSASASTILSATPQSAVVGTLHGGS